MSSVLPRSSDVVAELSLTDEILDLILEFVVVIGVMSYVAVVATILVLIHLCSLLPYGEGSYEVDPSFDRLKYFSSIGIQLSVVSVPSQRSWWSTILRSLPFMVIRLKLLRFPFLLFLILGVFGGGVSFSQGLLGILDTQVLFSPSIKLLKGPTVPFLQVIPKLGFWADSTHRSKQNSTLRHTMNPSGLIIETFEV